MMTRKTFVASCLLALGGMAAAATDGAPAGNLTAAQIVDRNVAARGGLQAWRAVNTLTMAGQLDAGGKTNAQLPFMMKMKRPHKQHMEISFQGQTAVQVYDGTQGWKFRPFLGRNEAEPYAPAEAKAAASWEELDGPLVDYAAKGTRVELVGTEAVEGNNTYKLKLTLKTGEQRHLWIDAKTFLEAKIDGEPKKMDGKLRQVAIYYRAYKTENRLTTPRMLETVVDGVKQGRKMEISRVAVNEPMNDDLFRKPDLMVAAAPGK